MRVLHLCYEYPPVGAGGGEACRHIVEGTGALGVENTVLTAHCPGVSRQESTEQVKVIRLFCARRKTYQCSIPEMFAYLLRSSIAGGWRVWRERFQLVHVHFALPSGPSGYLLRKLFGLPYIMTLQGGDVPSFAPQETAHVYRWIHPAVVPVWRAASGIYAVSPGLAALARQDYPEATIEVIPNGVDDAFFQAAGAKEGPFRFVFAGRFAPQKNLGLLLAAAAALPTAPPWELHLIGDGPLAGELRQQVRRSGLAQRVFFHGWVARQDLLGHFAAADCFVMPSLKEGLPLGALQAMAAGLPVIGSRTTGLQDILEHGRNGYLFQNNDEQDLATYLQLALGRRRELVALGAAARETADAYRWPNIAKAYYDVYRTFS